MKRKKSLFVSVMMLALAALAGCKDDPNAGKTVIEFWTGFGGAVNGVLQPLIAEFERLNDDIKVVYETKGGYDNLERAINLSVSNEKFPHIANGYPDHFASYADSHILLDLNSDLFINHPEHGVDVDSYFESFMHENRNLVEGGIVGLPFNKSTEIMVVNESFFRVAKLKDPTIYVPKTWQELGDVGEKLVAVVRDNNWVKKLVKHDGSTVDKPLNPKESELAELQPQIAFDMSNVDSIEKFIPFSYDSTSNFFITILRQWGATYTTRGATFQTGEVKFHKGESRTKAVEALAYMKGLYDRGIIGIPESFNESLYSSTPFKRGDLVLTVSSSAGIGENIPDSATNYPFEVGVHAVPYNADNPETSDAKSVISQGTNLALFARGDMRNNREQAIKERTAAWRLLRFLTYETNYEFAEKTGYFPVIDGSKLTAADPRHAGYVEYSEFLEQTTGNSREKAIRNTAIVQDSVYMNPDEQWTKFVDDAFIGSSRIREEAEDAMALLFSGNSPDEVIDYLALKLKNYAK